MENYYHRKYRNPAFLNIAAGCFILAFVLMALLVSVNSCNAQEQYYEVSWTLSVDGVTAEYLFFLVLTDDTTNIPFYDSLFTFPDQQWNQYLIGHYSHDSLYAINPERAVIEIMPTVNTTPAWMALAFFARSPDGWYSDRSVYVHDPAIPVYIRPNVVNAAGISVIRKLRWK